MRKHKIEKNNSHAKKKKLLTTGQRATIITALVFLAVIAVVIPLINKLNPSHAASGTELSLSPGSQSVATGSTITINVLYTAGGSSIKTVQSILTYNPANFNFVSATAGSAFSAAFPYSTASGSVTFSAASETAVTTDSTVATITLQATGTGSSNVNLASVCPGGDYNSNCSAVWDSVSSNNDLGSVSGASYSVTSSSSGGGSNSNTGGGGGTTTPPPSSSPPPQKSSTSAPKATNSKAATPLTTPLSTPQPAPSATAPTSTVAVTATTVYIYVSNSHNKPVKGAIVSLNGTEATTNANGIAAISAQYGLYKLVVTAKGSKTYTNSISVSAASSGQQFGVQLKPSLSIPWLYVAIVVVGIFVIIIGIAERRRHNLYNRPITPVPINPPVDHLDQPQIDITANTDSVEELLKKPKIIKSSSSINVITPTNTISPTEESTSASSSAQPTIIPASEGHVVGRPEPSKKTNDIPAVSTPNSSKSQSPKIIPPNTTIHVG